MGEDEGDFEKVRNQRVSGLVENAYDCVGGNEQDKGTERIKTTEVVTHLSEPLNPRPEGRGELEDEANPAIRSSAQNEKMFIL